MPAPPFYMHLRGNYLDMPAAMDVTVIDSSVAFTLLYFPSYNIISDVVDLYKQGFDYQIVSRYDTLEKWEVKWKDDTAITLKIKSPLRDTAYLFVENYTRSARLKAAVVDTTVLDPRNGKEAVEIRLTSVYFRNNNPSFLPDSSDLLKKRDSIIHRAMKKVMSYSPEEIDKMFFPFNYDLLANVEYNNNGLLVISYNYFSYTGGAHGYNDLTYYNIDVNTRQVLHLSDIMKTAGLKELIYKKLSQKDIVLFVDENTIYVPKNFFIKGRKIYFVYNTYEIAPYAEGTITVSFDFKEIKDRLNPEFLHKYFPGLKL